ncbi:hypothetical protein PMAYCL1PPCAC_20640 [Pristionchus mayeri]|uniref:Activin types I and II receptor domain-containing protein n=1 Tax=Pristionchus mayeri TaxID=1317129 RepID=A0AAN5I3S5_9BILA|nr:hypothetical protein PMAYCL1PPCAC_20640 [Pristionchus mayeri]
MRRRRRSISALKGQMASSSRPETTSPSSRETPSRGRILPRMLILFFCLVSLPLAAGVKCYCTDDHCVPYGACEGNACLVGILKESNQVIRTCGNQKIGCFKQPLYGAHDWDIDDKWSDLCVCAEEFCNTFSFLRQNTQKEKPHTFPQPVPASSSDHHNDDRNNGNGYNGFKQHPHHSDFADDDDHLVFQRVDRPDDGPFHNPDAPLATSFVTILLVVVPLTVGALTVVIVAFNYYCHLC